MQTFHSGRADRLILGTLAVALVVFAAACGTAARTPVRELGSAHDLPERFVRDTLAFGASPIVPEGEGCFVLLLDPRDGTRLRLMRSQHTESRASQQRGNTTVTTTQFGDYRGQYAVEAEGRYGLQRDELLDIDCVTGRVLGIARRNG